MGKGDKKSRRGKIFMGSYGVSRKRKKNKRVKFQISHVVKPVIKVPETIIKPKVAADIQEVITQIPSTVIVEKKTETLKKRGRPKKETDHTEIYKKPDSPKKETVNTETHKKRGRPKKETKETTTVKAAVVKTSKIKTTTVKKEKVKKETAKKQVPCNG